MDDNAKMKINRKEAATLFELLEVFTSWPYAKQNMYLGSRDLRDIAIFKTRLEYFYKIKCLGWKYDVDYGYYDPNETNNQ